jgi:riboflavin kinase, archaea type
VITGRMEAGGFLEVPWVKERIAGLLGAEPFPGTLNLRLVEEADRGLWRERVSSGACLAVIPPEEGFCPASYFPVEVDGLIPGGIILPHVEGYPEDVIELVAGGRLRDLLALADGDEVTVTLLPAEA